MSLLQPLKTAVPKHVGIILDGNRRFAKRLMMKPWQGHEWGAKKIRAVMDWAREEGVRELTLYCFSIENFHSRPKKEFDYLMDLFVKEFESVKSDEKLHKHQIRINFIGRIWMFSEKIQKAMRDLMEMTKKYDKYVINFAMAYGGRAEIVDAVKRVAEEVKRGKLNVDQINEEMFAQRLYMPDEPELVIRTGGEKRSSNFLNYQAAYSEWVYVEKMWPEFEKGDFVECLKEFGSRHRRFGK